MGFFNSKEKIDKDLELYKERRKLEIDREIHDYEVAQKNKSLEIQKMGTRQLGEYEHEFHNTKEEKGIELAKLLAKVEQTAEILKAREEVIKADSNIHKVKDAEIERLNNIIIELIKKQPSVTVQTIRRK